MKFNPFEEGKEYPEKDDDGRDFEYYENEGKKDIEEILDWYLNDTEESAEFMDNCKTVYKAETGKDLDESGVKEGFLEMIRDGLILIYFDVAFGSAGLMLKMDDGTYKAI